jgi:FAD/FMN-containing dehydrogenase
VEGGCNWGEVNDGLQPHGLAATGGFVSITGVSGLTLGGGLGWLVRKHGLALDNLLSAEVVLADGRLVTASARENDDLFWAIRGGGGNFGVVTSFQFQVHPVGTVLAGIVLHPATGAAGGIRRWRDLEASAPTNPPKARFCSICQMTRPHRCRCVERRLLASEVSTREPLKRVRRS